MKVLHNNSDTILGIITSDTLTITFYILILRIIFPINNILFIYFLLIRSIQHYISHHSSYFPILKNSIWVRKHLDHHKNPKYNFAPIWLDKIFRTFK